MKRALGFLWLVGIIFFVGYWGCTGNVKEEKIQIHLKAGTFDPLKEKLTLPSHPSIGKVKKEPGYYLVQFSSPILEQDRAVIKELGGKIIHYIPDYCFLVRINEKEVKQLESHPRVRWLGEYLPEYKIAPNLLEKKFYTKAEDTIKLAVQLFKEGEIEAITSKLEAEGAKVLKETKGVSGIYLRLEVLKDKLDEVITTLAQEPDVIWIEEYVPPVFHNDAVHWVVQSNQPNFTPLWDQGLDGSGQIVGISDSGLDADMCYFYDPNQGLPTENLNPNQRKVLVYHNWASSMDWDGHDHGTHTACTIAGDNSANLGQPDTYDGIAYNAKLVIQDIAVGGWIDGLPSDLNILFQEAYDEGARIHSNSWGAAVYGDYTLDSQQVDEFMWNHKDFLILFSAGNEGPVSGSIGSPATAKNCVSVGASENAHSGYDPENVADFSSNGPTEDDRIKPTIMAPGDYLISADNDGSVSTYNCGTRTMRGTSMSCPATAGLSALIRQYFTDGYYPSGSPNPSDSFIPSAALLKAVLVNSGVNMSGNYTDGPIPSSGQGWGRALADNVLYFSGEDRKLAVVDETAGLSTGMVRSYTYFSDGTFPFKATLVWTDYPSTASASVHLVNDLDLVVTDPTGEVYYGNVFSGGESISGGSPDRRNVVEQVLISQPVPGDYHLEVIGYNVPQPPQPFALVVSGVVSCTGEGMVSLDRAKYSPTTPVGIRLSDCDLNLNPSLPDQASVQIISSTETTPELVYLMETDPSSGIFEGSISLALGNPISDGVLQVADEDTITVFYNDSSPPQLVTATALVDARAPLISKIEAHPKADGTRTTISWETDEPATSKVIYGPTPALGFSVLSSTLVQSHSIEITGLTPSQTYYFDVQSTDEVGNQALADNGGAHYTFNTSPPDIEVNPSSFSVNLYQGQKLSQTFTIFNRGSGADLSWWIPSGYLYICDWAKDALKRMDAEKNLETIFNLGKPWGVTFKDNYIYVGSASEEKIYKIDQDGNGMIFYDGVGNIHSLVLGPDGMFYAGSCDAGIIYRITPDGQGNIFVSGVNCPTGMVFDSQGNLYVSEYYNNRIIKIDPQKNIEVIATGIDYPHDLAFDSQGNLYVGSRSHYIRKISPNGTVTNFASLPGCSRPCGVTIDQTTDSIFASCANDGKIYVIDQNGVPTFLVDAGGPEVWNIALSGPFSSESNWILVSPSRGTIPANGFQEVELVFSSDGLDPGDYQTILQIQSDDPDESSIDLPVSLTVIASPNIIFDSLTIDDDSSGESSGDGDGIIEPLEVVELKVGLKNIGSIPASNVIARLSSADPSIRILDDTESYGSIPIGGSASSQDDYQILPLSTAPDEEEIPLELYITDGSYEWHRVFYIQVSNKSQISGTVLGASDSLPIAGAEVHYLGPESGSITTDDGGRYVIKDLDGGNYELWASAPGYLDSDTITVSVPPSVSGIDFSLERLPFISGNVSRAEDGSPVPGAEVSYNGPVSGNVVTDSRGDYFILNLPAGSYTLRASASNLSPSPPVLITVPPSATGVNFSLQSLSEISGTVINLNTGTGLSGAVVSYTGPKEGSTISDLNGDFHIFELPAGDYQLQASASGYEPSPPVSVSVPPDQSGIILEVGCPEIEVNPTSVAITLPPEVIDYRLVQVSNLGGAPLTFDARVDMTFPPLLIFDDDFEGPNQGWTHGGNNDSWEMGTPSVGPSQCHSGVFCWGTNLSGNYLNDSNMWLMTPPIDLDLAFSQVTLTFWHWYSTEWCCDYAYLEISTDGQIWSRLKEYRGSSQGFWIQESVDLSNFIGKVIYLRFRLLSDFSITYPGWYIDDVRIEGRFSKVVVQPTTGTVEEGGSKSLKLKFDTRGVPLGNYSGNLIIDSNDPDEASLSVPLTLNVVAGAPHIALDSYLIDDDTTGESQGNGDGIPSPAESIEIPVTLINDSDVVITGVSATLSTQDPYITITDNSENFGDIQPGEQVSSLDDFDLIINPSVSEGHTVELILTITDGVNSWYDMIQFEIVNVPEIEVSPSSINVSVYAGHTLTDKLLISNLGLGDLNFTIEIGSGETVVLLEDDFPTTSFDPNKWVEVNGQINSLGINPPSPPYVLDLKGQNYVVSKEFNLYQSPISYSYYFEVKGAGEDPDPGDNLYFEWWDGSNWIVEQTHTYQDGSNNNFTLVTGTLPSGVLKIRFRNSGAPGFDDYLVDNIQIIRDTSIPWLIVNPDSGTVLPGDSLEIELNFSAQNLDVGVYNAELKVHSNDFNKPEISIPISMTVKPAPKLKFLSYLVDDDSLSPSQGNANGFVEPGEQIELTVNLFNEGSGSANNVQLTLSSNSPLVTIIDNQSSIALIPPKNSASSQPPFCLKIDDQAGDGEKIPLELEAIDQASGLVFNLSFELMIYRVPEIEVGEAVINLSAAQGEVAQTNFQISNLGSADLVVLMESSQSWLTISPPSLVVRAGDSSTVDLIFKPEGLTSGSYQAKIYIYSNDFDEPQLEIEVIAQVLPGVYLSSSQMLIDDDSSPPSSGDGDGVAEPGEKIELGIELINLGELDALGVSAQLSSNSSFLKFLKDTANYGDIPGGAKVSSQDKFLLKIDSSLSCEQQPEMLFTIQITNPNKSQQETIVLPTFCSYTIKGVVVEENLGGPISFAEVNYERREGGYSGQVLASEQGEFEILHLVSGHYQLWASKSLCYPSGETQEVSLPPDNQEVTLKLKAPYLAVEPSPVLVDLFADDLEGKEVKAKIKNQGSLEVIIEETIPMDSFTVKSEGEYYWTDNQLVNRVKYQWVEVLDQGTVIQGLGDDTNLGPFPIGFNFPFYGEEFDSFRVCSNGFISLTSSSNSFLPRALPSEEAPENLIAFFWTDLDLAQGGTVGYHFDGDKLVVSFVNVFDTQGRGPYSFEAILYSDGKILFQYQLLAGPVNIASIGIQNQTKDQGVNLSFQDDYLKEGMAVLLSPTPILLPSAESSQATLEPGDSVEINVQVAPGGKWLLPGVYEGKVLYYTNNPCLPVNEIDFIVYVHSLRFISTPPSEVLEGELYFYQAQAEDLAGSTVTYQLAEAPEDMTIAPDTGEVQWQTDFNDLGEHQVKIIASNALGEQVSQEFTIRVLISDADQDRMPDTWETYFGLDPNQNDAYLDPDEDGITNYLEYLYGFSPREDNQIYSDQDEDGMPDDYESLVGLDPQSSEASEDPDGDFLTNLVEYYSGTPPMLNNAQLDDTDQDGMPDRFEWAHGLDPTTRDNAVDLDEDGIVNIIELWLGTDPRVDNSLLADQDEDMLPDRWEQAMGLNPEIADPDQDPDNDGLPNLVEYLDGSPACLNNYNIPDQDNDLLPDYWELANLTDPEELDQDNDPDGDDYPNYFEYRVGSPAFLANEYLEDSDQDKMPENWEIALGTNPKAEDDQIDFDDDGLNNLIEYRDASSPQINNSAYQDADGDLIPDYWEWAWQVDAPQADPDEDGIENYDEYLRGTNPLRSNYFDYQIILEPKEVKLQVGETVSFRLQGAQPPISWKITNEQVCEFSANQVIRGLYPGKCTLVVEDINKVRAKALIEVVSSKESIQPPPEEKGGGDGGNGGCNCQIGNEPLTISQFLSEQIFWLFPIIFFLTRLWRKKKAIN